MSKNTPVFLDFPGGSDSKESTCNAGDLGSIPGLGRSPGEGKGSPLQYSGLENSIDYVETMGQMLTSRKKSSMDSRKRLETWVWTSQYLRQKLIHFHPACAGMLSCSVVADSLGTCGLQPARLLWSWDFPGKNTGVAISFSRESSWPRDWIWVSCIGRWILHHWATWEAPPFCTLVRSSHKGIPS